LDTLIKTAKQASLTKLASYPVKFNLSSVSYVGKSNDGFVGTLLGHKFKDIGGFNVKNKKFWSLIVHKVTSTLWKRIIDNVKAGQWTLVREIYICGGREKIIKLEDSFNQVFTRLVQIPTSVSLLIISP
jgi:hypothetical protein